MNGPLVFVKGGDLPKTEPASELAPQANDYAAQAAALTITDDATERKAGELLTAILGLERKITEEFEPHRSSAHAVWKGLCDAEKRHLEPLKRAEATMKTKVLNWRQELRRRAEAEQRAAEEKARREAEEQRLAEAIQMDQTGADPRDVEEHLEAPIVAPPVVVEQQKAQVAGVAGTTEVWDWKVVNASLVPDSFKKLDDAKIGGVVRAMKGQTSIPGIEVYSRERLNLSRKGV